MDTDAKDDADALQTFRRHIGPDTFARGEALAAFVLIADVHNLPGMKPAYYGDFREDPIAFLHAYMPTLPQESMAVTGMQHPLIQPAVAAQSPQTNRYHPL